MEQLPDTSVAQSWRSAVFLFRQPFLLVPGVLATIGIAAFFLQAMTANGRASAEHVLQLVAIAPLCGFGVAVLTALPAFMIQRFFRPKITFEPDAGEVVVHTERANHFLRHEGRGGALTITNRRIVFTPHRFNVQLSTVEQPLARVRDLAFTRVVDGTGNVFSHVLHVREEGREERYVVKNAPTLGARIEEAKRGAEEAA